MTETRATVVDAGPAPLRRDAARNRSKILAAARVAFDEEGVDVGVEEIAQRAGVGVGTLYRRFPTKELLIEAVVEEVLASVLAAAEEALASGDPGGAFATYLRAVGQLHAEHAGCVSRLWTDSPSELRARIEACTRQLLADAQAAGTVRPDLVYEDVSVLFWSMRGVLDATSPVAPDAWLRHLELLLIALAPGGRPLDQPPLTAEQLGRAKLAMATRRAADRRGRTGTAGA
jgi:AcrR family transcriptional regulator